MGEKFTNSKFQDGLELGTSNGDPFKFLVTLLLISRNHKIRLTASNLPSSQTHDPMS